MHTTSRLSLPIPDTTDNESAFPVVSGNQMDALDVAVRYFSGTISNRSTVVPSPVAGDEYGATDEGLTYKYSGSVWVPLIATSGSAIIATSQSTSNTSYVTLASSDEVTGLVLPAAGLIAVWYQATWQESVAGAARAAIFVGSSQLVVQGSASGPVENAPVASAAAVNSGGGSVGKNAPLFSYTGGVASAAAYSAGMAGDATTGQAIGFANTNAAYVELNGSIVSLATDAAYGGPCHIFAAAGTYTVSVRFKASSGSVTVSNRRLYARVLTF